METREVHYDMNCQYSALDKKFKLTLQSLCEEILEDCYTDEKSITVDSVREKIKNAKNSGLINRLLKYLDFDIEAIAKENSKETFDEYKLLKLLYLMEHKGFIFEEQRYEKVPILDLLSKPRLENVHSVFSDNDHHGVTYEYLCKSIEPFVKDLDGRCEKLQKVSSEWEQVAADMINYFVELSRNVQSKNTQNLKNERKCI